MTKIEELAKEYAYDIDGSDWERQRARDGFIDGANAFMSLPLVERMNEEEKENIRFAHKTAKAFAMRNAGIKAETFKSHCLLLESIFGKVFFKEERK